MVYAQNLSVEFGGRTLFKDVSFRINQGDRIGLAGKNGAGKSTLLKILAKEDRPTEGSVNYEGEATLGFLKQDIDFIEGRTVWEEANQAFERINRIKEQLEECNVGLTTRTDYETDSYMNLIEDVTKYTEQFSMLGGYTLDADTEKILKGLGFSTEDFTRQTTEFSGGWRMRIELAKLLLQKPDVMLMDEPTNHLDLDSILWLEDFLKEYPGAILLVSHDKLFLDNVTNRTLEISNRKVHDYKANYSKYLQLREERREQLELAKKNQDQYVKHTQDLINKFRAKASKASTARSLQKKLDRLEDIDVEKQDVHSMNIKFEPSQRSGKVVFNLKNVGKAFGDRTIFKNVEFEIVRGEKVAFLGQNGQGKTTLARAIVGEIDYTGEIEHGHNVEIGYFAQNQHEILKETNTVLQEAEDSASEHGRSSVRDVLGAFLFSGEAADKKVSVLSGGERNRLALAKLLLHPSNVLIMDEPTNHLDIQSKEILKNALKNYEGTLILVSHDREFLDGLADKIIEFKSGRVTEFLGGIEAYLAERQAENMRQVEQADEVQPKKVEQKRSTSDVSDDKKAMNKLSNLESQITALETKMEKLEKGFGDSNPSEEDLAKYNQLKIELVNKTKEWEQLAEQLI